MHQLNLRRQKLVDPVFDNRVRLSAANFHDGPRTRGDGGDRLSQFLSGNRVPILVLELHAAPRFER
jgi:hypothetical protein